MKYNSKMTLNSLVSTANDLNNDARRMQGQFPIPAGEMQGRSYGLLHAVNALKPIIEDREKEIMVKRRGICVLFIWFIFSIIYIVSLKNDIVILQDYNDTIEAVDYNGPQD